MAGHKDYVNREFSVANFKEFAPKLVPIVPTDSFMKLRSVLNDAALSDPANNESWSRAMASTSDRMAKFLERPEETDILALNKYLEVSETLDVAAVSAGQSFKESESVRKDTATFVATALQSAEQDAFGYQDPVNVLVRSVDATSRQPKPGYRVYYATGYAHELGCLDQTKRPFPTLTQSENLLRRGVYWLWLEENNEKTEPLEVDISLTQDGQYKVDLPVTW